MNWNLLPSRTLFTILASPTVKLLKIRPLMHLSLRLCTTNSPLNIAIQNSNSVLGGLLNELQTPEEKIDLVYRAMLTRKPTRREVERILADYQTHGEETIEDLVWALLNSAIYFHTMIKSTSTVAVFSNLPLEAFWV